MAWIDALFKRMLELDASDLHMTSNKKPMLRLHGEMAVVDECSAIKPTQMRQILMEITPPANKKEYERDCDTDFAYQIPGLARFRCNLFMDNQGPGGVFRLIPETVLTADQLGLPQSVRDFCFMSKGLVLVTGPTGSGKSTTLAAMIDVINGSRTDHIITIEDPIEFVHKDKKCLINQRQVGGHTESFKRALRAALREDPDVVLVGELRDLDTMEIAIETAETGHLVFGTLHTTTAASTINRIIDQFPADRQAQIRTMLAASLKGVVAQVLCKRVESGRIAAMEVLIVNNAVSSLIREGKTHQIVSSMQMGGKEGMRLMNDSLLDLVQRGEVEPGEAFHVAVDKVGLVAGYENAGIEFEGFELDRSVPVGEGPAPLPGVQPAGAPANPKYEADPFEQFKSRKSG